MAELHQLPDLDLEAAGSAVVSVLTPRAPGEFPRDLIALMSEAGGGNSGRLQRQDLEHETRLVAKIDGDHGDHYEVVATLDGRPLGVLHRAAEDELRRMLVRALVRRRGFLVVFGPPGEVS